METKQTVQAATLMIQGTSSDVGKSILTAALCRIFMQDGLRVAPFKSQNMSLNSYVTPDGKEIGRAQGVQADACRIPATADMNPILLKPKGDMTSQVVVHGKPHLDMEAKAYRESYLPLAEGIVKESLARLRQDMDLVLLEGAGSPAEINLKDRDIVNMRMAEWADAPVLLVADIDRGGVFASIVGTLEILNPEERKRVKGFIINKFRGDVSLLRPGIDWLEQKTGKPVLGVVPYLPQFGIEDEDTASLDSKRVQNHKSGADSEADGSRRLDIAVLRLPRISNFTDMDPLYEETDVRIRYVSHLDEWGNPDALIIPGSKNTSEDLLFLQKTGLARRIIDHAENGKHVAGICGGYQMLGEALIDPGRIESDHTRLSGLGLLPLETEFISKKQTVRVEGNTCLFAAGSEAFNVGGYEIHMGRTWFTGGGNPIFRVRTILQGQTEGSSEWRNEGAENRNGRIWGTYVHGILHNDNFRRAWLNDIRLSKGWEPLSANLRYQEKREAAFDRLAGHVRKHLDISLIYEMIQLQKKNGLRSRKPKA